MFNISYHHPLTHVRLMAGFACLESAAAWLSIHPRTLARHEAEDTRGPIRRALELKMGDLGALDPAWAGWWLYQGKLRFESQEWTPGNVLASQYERALIAELKRRVRKYETAAPVAPARPSNVIRFPGRG